MEEYGGNCPRLEEWVVLCYASDGKENRARVMRAFTDFWEDRSRTTLFPPGDLVLGGKIEVYDGDNIVTDKIFRIERVNRTGCGEGQHRLLRALTRTGGAVCLCPYDTADEMLTLLSDIIRFEGEVPDGSDRYLPEEYRDKGFL